MNINLSTKAVLVSLNIGIWGANKMDKQVSNEIADSKKLVDKKMVRAWKSLLAKNEYYDAINAIASKARKFHYENTFAWISDGQRLLPTANYDAYMTFMRQVQRDFMRAVNQFITHYPTLKEAAESALNSIYKECDYPAAESLLKRFYLNTYTMPVPAGTMFEADVNETDADRIREDIDKQVTEAFRAANQELWDRMYATINRLHARLTSPKGVREQTLKSLREMLGLLDRLNVSGNERLEHLRQQALARIGTLSANDLNASKEKKGELAVQAKQIEDSMAEFMGGSAHAA